MWDARDYACLWAWEPIHPKEMAELLAGFTRPWWICGGWALDLFLDRETRRHDDLDIAVLRPDQVALFDHLRGWDLHYATPAHALEPWDGRPLDPPIHGIWARRATRANAPGRASFCSTRSATANGSFAAMKRSGGRCRRWATSAMACRSFAPRSVCSTRRPSHRRRTTPTSPSSNHISVAKRVSGCWPHSRAATIDTLGSTGYVPTGRDLLARPESRCRLPCN